MSERGLLGITYRRSSAAAAGLLEYFEDVSRGPWKERRPPLRHQGCDPQKRNPARKQPTMVGLTRAINAGSTFCGAQPKRRVPWKNIDPLLRRPLGRRMFGDMEMNDTATLVAKDDEDEHNSGGCGRQSEKVERHQVLCMIIEKAPPSMGRWGSWLPYGRDSRGRRECVYTPTSDSTSPSPPRAR